jgi:cytochrome c oxidase cbb3-type subunit 3
MNRMAGSEEIAERPTPGAPHNDGIAEDDHAIPVWFNAAFLATIVFAFVYVIYYVVLGWTSRGQYEAEVAEAEAIAAVAKASQPDANPYHGDAAAIADGQQVFTQICAACHKPDASGLVGPSLVDPYWKYGHTDAELYESVMVGRPGGMPGWGAQLGSEKVWRALAYLESLPKTNAPGVGAPDYAPPAPAPTPGS